ncbi:MAG: hypothetical protein LAN64_14260 [Acidobacteriia bacterium]|nr:hypothetical protein [Terriglobia bacterium]
MDLDLAGDEEGKRKLVQETWGNREPFPEDVEPAPADAPTTPTLEGFLQDVAAVRASFAQRLRPGVTLCFDHDGREYLWPENDPASIARRYAQDVVEKKIVAGDLVIRACARFLTDLEEVHTRGVYFDPAEARLVIRFCDQFVGLHTLPWQTWLLCNLMGFKRANGYRRFTECWLSTAKKSGKTTLASAIALWALIADLERLPECYSAATRKEQAKISYVDARRAVADNPELREWCQRYADRISIRETDGTFMPLAANEKLLDGLRPSLILADEIAFWDSRATWDTLVKGIVSRVQPLVVALTTCGPTKQCFAFTKFDLAEKILRGIYQDDSTLAAIYSIDKDDDPLDEACWFKANPSLGTTLLVEHLRKTRDEVLQDPSGRNSFVQYHANQWPEVGFSRPTAITPSAWEACSGMDLMPDCKSPMEAYEKFLMLNRDLPAYGGLDVGMTSDTSFFVALWPRARFAEGQAPVDKKVVIAQCFMPELGLLEKEKAWQVPLSTWARDGYISLCAGDLQDPKEIRKFILDFASRFRIHEIGFDTWNAQVMCAEINESGSAACVAVPQVPKELTAPCREILQWVHSKELVHFNSPVAAWQACNVVLAEDPNHGGTKPGKLAPQEKIDFFSALANAAHRMLANPVQESVYSKRGIIFI